MKHFKNKVVWITGASSGIGEAVALEFAKRGAKLILSARSEDKLKVVADNCSKLGSECYVLPLDLEQLETLVGKSKEAIDYFGRIDILFNNGGIGQRSLSYETPFEIDRKIMNVDYFSYVIITKEVLRQMLKQGSGHIVANSSISGKFGFIYRSAYSAAKHAIYGFFESMRIEVLDKGIDVTIVTPGRINTPISMSALTKSGEAHGKFDKGQAEGMPVDKCAKIIVNSIARKKVEILIGKKEVLMVHIKRFFPRLFYKLVVKVKDS